VGRLKERYWTEAAAEYSKRLSSYLLLRLFEVDDRVPAGFSDAQVLAKEAADIKGLLLKQRISSPLILLDILGKQTSSEALAQRLTNQELSGNPSLAFIIGGSLGVDASIRQLSDEQLSFGPITLPHNLARIVLLEQLYRATKINRNEPYHK